MYSKSLLFISSLNIAFLLINYGKAQFSSAPATFEIKIRDGNELVKITVKKVPNSYLANERLPVWKTTGNSISPYEELNVKQEIGTIIPYFNYQTGTALIYSLGCNCVDGVIGMRYIIKKLPISLISQTQVIGQPSSFVKRRTTFLMNQSNSNKTDPSRTEEELKINERAVNKTLYPEILIVVKNDFYLKWKSINENDGEMIRYIITLMNAVDMLYSPTKILKLKLNIAGIIIESQPNHLPGETNNIAQLSAESLVDKVKNSDYSDFEKFKLNPNLSYDWIFFLTSKYLSYSLQVLPRISSYPKNGVFESRQNGCGSFSTPISIFTDDYNFVSYPTIAHEIFHLLTHGSHKKVESKKCDFEFLDVYDNVYLEKFLWSNDCCFLTNKPELQFSHTSMDLISQCQCYGYEKNFLNDPPECIETITCQDSNGLGKMVPRISDNKKCRDEWEQEKQKLLYVAASTSPTISTTTIPSLTFEDQCSWIIEELDKIIFIRSENDGVSSEESVCLGIVVEHDNSEGDGSDVHQVGFTEKSCLTSDIQISKYSVNTDNGIYTFESQNGDTSSMKINSETVGTLYYFELEQMYDDSQKLSSLKKSVDIMNLTIKECRMIDVTRSNNNNFPYKISYIPVKILIQKNPSSSDILIRSEGPVNKTQLHVSKGNPLFCSISDKTEFIGILVDNNNENYLRFKNIADDESTE